MSLKTILRLTTACILIFSSGFAREKITFPTYRNSNPSTRFVNYNPDFVTQSKNLQKQGTLSFQAVIPDTLRVMAIRVQFQRDNDRNTTGDGWFDLSVGDSMINPPPHNQRYFSNQLRALRNYYQNVSNGKLFLQVENDAGVGHVYPLESDSVWTLPHEMSYYNPDDTEELLDQRLAELFRDAFTLADADGDIDFSKFDCFIVFHAGVGWEFTQEFDTTPNDIPSVFLNFNDFKKTIGNNSPDFKGIAVNNGSFFIKDGIILPETENQGGYNFFGLLGTAVLMTGYQLGLPGLFNTETGNPGIGRFGIMDQGSGNFFGNIPAQPCAWSKIFLGWEQPIEITSGQKIPVAAALANNPAKIYKIPINAREYYLVENRQRTVRESRSIGVGFDENGTRIEFYDDGTYNPVAGIGVIVSINEFDYGLPGSGILIWHIDESVIEQKYPENRVNTDMNHRGVDLVEADGSQDMGYFYNNFGFMGYHAGYAEDMWWDRNEYHLYANSSEKVMFTPFTMPPSQAHSRAQTGIYITDFSPQDSVMYFSLEIKKNQPGFPAYLGGNSGNSALVVGDVTGNGTNEIILTTQNGKILAWQANGTGVISNNDVATRIEINGDTTTFPLAVFAELSNGQFQHTPSLADLDSDGKMEVIAGATTGKLYAWKAIDSDGNGRADTIFEIDCGASITTVPVCGDWNLTENGLEIAVGLENGDVCLIRENGDLVWKTNVSGTKIVGLAGFIDATTRLICVDQHNQVTSIDGNGTIIWQKSFTQYGTLHQPVIGNMPGSPGFSIIISSQDGYLFILDRSGAQSPLFTIVATGAPLSRPTLADINGDNSLDIVLTGGGKIFAYNFNGVSLADFPVIFDRGFEDASYPEPILADLNGDGKVEIIVGSKNNQLMAFDYKGRKVPGFPLSVSQPITSPPALTSLETDGKLNVIARADDDFCYAWKLDYAYDPNRVVWGQYLRDAQHTGSYLKPLVPPIKEASLLPEKMVYNYPNPTEGNATTIRYYLRDAAEVSIRIYDMAGELVTELSGPGLEGIENEVIWDLTTVQSGVYFARVAAKAATERSVVIIKIAVLK